MSEKLEHATNVVAACMDAINELFVNDVKITVLVRTPDNPRADFMLTNDEPEEAIAMITRRIAAGPTQ